MSAPRTDRQNEVLAAIRRLTVDGVPPSVAEIAAALGYSYKAGVHSTLVRLRDRGLITWTPRAARSIQVVDPADLDLPALLADVAIALQIALNRYDGVDLARTGEGPVPQVDGARAQAKRTLSTVLAYRRQRFPAPRPSDGA